MKKLICEDEVNIAVANWFKQRGAVNVKRLTGREHGFDVSGEIDGVPFFVESKGETPNDPNKTHEFQGSDFDISVAEQVFKALSFQKNHPECKSYIANPANKKIAFRLNKIDWKKLDISTLWVRPDMTVYEGEFQKESEKSNLNTVINNPISTYELTPNPNVNRADKSNYNSEQLGGYKFGIALAILFPNWVITETMIRNCSTISGSYPEAASIFKYLTNQGGSKDIKIWVEKHGGKEAVLASGRKLLESNPVLTEAIKNEVNHLLGIR